MTTMTQTALPQAIDVDIKDNNITQQLMTSLKEDKPFLLMAMPYRLIDDLKHDGDNFQAEYHRPQKPLVLHTDFAFGFDQPFPTIAKACLENNQPLAITELDVAHDIDDLFPYTTVLIKQTADDIGRLKSSLKTNLALIGLNSPSDVHALIAKQDPEQVKHSIVTLDLTFVDFSVPAEDENGDVSETNLNMKYWNHEIILTLYFDGDMFTENTVIGNIGYHLYLEDEPMRLTASVRIDLVDLLSAIA